MAVGGQLVPGGGTILTSPDGVNWVTQSAGSFSDLHGITWNGSQFVAVGDSGSILTSPDGTNLDIPEFRHY